MKYVLLCFALLSALLIASCKHDDAPLQDIRVGSDNVQQLQVNPNATRMVLLSGGSGRYTVNIADSHIATVSLSKDTLRITGQFLGTTFLTIHSHDFTRRIPVEVVAPNVVLSADSITLHPRDILRTLRIAGGGTLASFEVSNPEEAVRAEWDAKTGEVVLTGLQEGDARITVRSQNGTSKSVAVAVRCAGSSDRMGLYSTSSRSLSTAFRAVMTVHRPGKFVRFSAAPSPTSYERHVLTITPDIQQPKVGERRNIQLHWLGSYESLGFRSSQLKEGQYSALIEEVRLRQVVLRIKGYKLVVPYRS